MRMSGPSQVAHTPIEHRQQLVDYLASGAKPRSAWRVGTEHEKFGFRLDDLRPPPYDGERGIRALLEGLSEFGWQRVEEHGHLIALTRHGASVTLEPAGQLELSGAPLESRKMSWLRPSPGFTSGVRHWPPGMLIAPGM